MGKEESYRCALTCAYSHTPQSHPTPHTHNMRTVQVLAIGKGQIPENIINQ